VHFIQRWVSGAQKPAGKRYCTPPNGKRSQQEINQKESMSASIKEARKCSSIASAQVRLAKAILVNHIMASSRLIDEETIKDLKQATLILGSDNQVIESYLSEFERIGIKAHTFAHHG
jgi:hypothetical protein